MTRLAKPNGATAAPTTFPAIPPADVLRRLAALKTAPAAELQAQWRELFGKDARFLQTATAGPRRRIDGGRARRSIDEDGAADDDQQVVYLKEVEGDRTFPILIGLFVYAVGPMQFGQPVRITATTVNSGDARMRAARVPQGMRTLFRLAMGWNKPRQPVGGLRPV